MDRDYARPLDMPALAAVAHVSPSHFIRVFRATFGETPHRYLQRRRVERAMALLRDTDRSGDGRLPRRRLHQPRHLQPDVPSRRRRVARGYRAARRGRRRLSPTCFTKAWTGQRAVSEKTAGAAQVARP